MPAQDVGLVRRGKALRAENKVGADRVRIALVLLGVHPKNRGGQYPAHEAVVDLCCRLVRDGFDVEEANHLGVCVAELPANDQIAACHPKTTGFEGYETYTAYNQRKCAAVAALRWCFPKGAMLMYGTLSHSHLLLALLSLKNRAAWTLPEKYAELRKWQDGEHGPWKTEALCEKDPALAEILRDGLLFEVMSPDLYVKHPADCSLISQALNHQHELGLQTTETTAVAVTADAVESLLAEEKKKAQAEGRDVNARIKFEDAVEIVARELPSIAYDEEFMDVFGFVVDIGGRCGAHLETFLEFARRFVNPKERKLRWEAFRMANALGVHAPRVKIALLMRAYRQKPVRGYVPLPEAGFAKMAAKDKGDWEDFLRFWWYTCKDCANGKTESDTFRLRVHVSIASATAAAQFISQNTFQNRSNPLRKLLVEGTKRYWDELATAVAAAKGKMPNPNRGCEWIDYTKVDESAAEAKSASLPASAVLRPALMQFAADGSATGEQETREKEGRKAAAVAALPWKEWARGSLGQRLGREGANQSAMRQVFRAHELAELSSEQPVAIFVNLDSKKKFVKATAAVPVGALSLFPCSPKAKTFLKTSGHPERVEISLTQRRPEPEAGAGNSLYYLTPEFKAPEQKSDGSTAVAERVEEPEGGAPPVAGIAEGVPWQHEGHYWHFSGDESLWPFWAVERATAQELAKMQQAEGGAGLRFNVQLRTRTFCSTVVGSLNGKLANLAYDVAVPVLENHVPLAPGDVLLLEAGPKQSKRAASITWRDDAKKTAHAKPKAAPKKASDPLGETI